MIPSSEETLVEGFGNLDGRVGTVRRSDLVLPKANIGSR